MSEAVHAPGRETQELQRAFDLFNQVSRSLTLAYQELQERVESLTAELAVANGELRRQYEAKEALSERLSLLLNALPLKLAPDEEMQSTYSFNYVPGEKSALNPFNVNLSDGKLSETVKVHLLALRKGEAIAFAYDMDRDGFDDYVLENEFLRLIVSPNAGARAFALINKRTGANVFTSVGGLRDKFVELDPTDPTRNARRKRGMYGTFNRPYAAEIVSGMGGQALLKLTYNATEVYPAGALIERHIALQGGEEFFTVEYRITPNEKTVDGKQAFWAASSVVVGDPANQARRFLSEGGGFDFATLKTWVSESDVIVDALLGTALMGSLQVIITTMLTRNSEHRGADSRESPERAARGERSSNSGATSPQKVMLVPEDQADQALGALLKYSNPFELQKLLGDPAEQKKFAERIGALRPIGEGTWEVPSPTLLRASRELVALGIPLAVLDLAWIPISAVSFVLLLPFGSWAAVEDLADDETR